MTKLKKFWNHLSLRWKWTIAGAASIFLAFSLFSLILIVAMSQWMIQEEESSVDAVLNDLADFYQSRGPRVTIDDVYESRDLLEQIYEKGQTIRLYNQDGFEMFTIQNEQTPLSVPFSPISQKEITAGKSKNQDVLVGRSPIRSQQFNGYVEVIHPLTMYKSMQNYMILLSLILGVGALLFSGVIAYLMAGRFVSPVVALGLAMRKTQKEGFQQQLDIPVVQDEVGGLVEIFNEMMDELESTFMKQRQFVEDASHELRTPIQIIEGHLSLINRWGKEDPAVLEESLGISIQELDRIKRLVNELLILSKTDREVAVSPDATAVPNKIIQTVTANIKNIHPDRTLAVSLEDEDEVISIDPHHLEQLLIILLENAIKYSSEDKPIEIKTTKSGHFFEISVQDKGSGIPSEHIPYIFDRFYRVDKARSRDQGGNGLGLSIAKRLLTLYNADIAVESKLNMGTKMTMRFPVINQSDQ
ncbi:HAMP domain-containing histidine kinase [Jeotgalibacillus sp. S-D1]|uniref:HAMP domain-containing sensor histidine kinase n=1 Tax=Jeotgalibacillus sp. S-D1 TaxID=2552189 RepID=UPI00105A28B1|nr:HAMP domain-containing histidine kinase [Jeotgalibacillus sp. S-D1]TDL34856.1 HAMP domain-containing histidine kinase [Jeotgalibacillus sp. S-D1]